MFGWRRAMVGGIALLAGLDSIAAESQAPRWRPATAAEIEAASGQPAGIVEAASANGAVSTASDGLRAFIDPTSGRLIEPASNADLPQPPPAAAAMPDFRLRRSADGFLYIDTRGYQHVEQATFGADGSLRHRCDQWPAGHAVADHDAAPDAVAPPEPAAPQARERRP